MLQTLTLITKDGQILLGLKKRGFGLNRWNGFGGKLEPDETVEEAAKREVFEEIGLGISKLEKVGLMNFSWTNKDLKIEMHVFKATDFTGQPEEGEEMKPQWFDLDKIPYKQMWPDDPFWLPLFLEGKKFEARFLFGDKDVIIEHEVKIL
ncbi:MAG: 8-oxo-dGTP diphosphatase [Patescibacteria group bacterium]|jgi:8-oxo-dGTP diphosphatase/2-hydroxy-dATP diphosphatase